MNFVDDRTLPLCLCCGAPLYHELDLADASGLACDSCFAESEAAMAKAQQAEADSDFRWQSREWFRSPAAAVLRKAEILLQWDRFEERNRALPAEEQ